MQARRAIVEVAWGPLQGRKAVLAPGQVMRFGRTDFADFEVPHDRAMSGEHFELGWDGATCTVRDLESVAGTQLNGEAGLTEGKVENGGWIKAGETIFTVHIEGATRSLTDDEADEEDIAAETKAIRARTRAAREALVTQALSVLRAEAEGARLFAVLDAARDRRILTLCRESVEECRSLYDGLAGEKLADAAPYLVAFEDGSPLLEALVREGWARRWGIFLTATLPPIEVRRHLRRFLLVEDEETTEPYYFRFYDPGTLRVFLPTCSSSQTEAWFGEIATFIAEGDDGRPLVFRAP